MTQQYLLIKARNIVTGQTVKNQDAAGSRLELRQRVLAQDLSQQLAARMTERTGQLWQGFVETYTPSVRNS